MVPNSALKPGSQALHESPSGTSPGSHALQFAWPALETLPSAHRVLIPEEHFEPGVHRRHSVESPLAYSPCGHATQVKAPLLEVWPTPHALHDTLPPTLAVPGSHSTHSVEPLAARERLPTGQAMHVVKAPVEYEPPTQGWQQLWIPLRLGLQSCPSGKGDPSSNSPLTKLCRPDLPAGHPFRTRASDGNDQMALP